MKSLKMTQTAQRGLHHFHRFHFKTPVEVKKYVCHAFNSANAMPGGNIAYLEWNLYKRQHLPEIFWQALTKIVSACQNSLQCRPTTISISKYAIFPLAWHLHY